MSTMSREQIMNVKLKQLHNLNRAMQNSNNPDIRKVWMDKFHALILKFAEEIRNRQPIGHHDRLNE